MRRRKPKAKPKMRTLAGTILLPADAPSVSAGKILLEIRDVTQQDAPSVIVAQTHLERVSLQPNGRIPFTLSVPTVAANRQLALRVHVSLSGGEQVTAGDLLTTQHTPIPSQGSVSGTDTTVERISS